MNDAPNEQRIALTGAGVAFGRAEKSIGLTNAQRPNAWFVTAYVHPARAPREPSVERPCVVNKKRPALIPRSRAYLCLDV